MKLQDRWQFIIGQLGERAVASALKRAGACVIASCEFSGQNDNHAPVLEFEKHNLTLPDLDVATRGKRCWWEIKTYDRPIENRTFKCWVHGVPVRLYDHYVSVERETGSEIYLAILELATSELLVSARPLSKMSKHECLCPGKCRSVDLERHVASNRDGIKEPQWYFDRDDFEFRFQIDRKTITDIRDRKAELRGHATQRHGSRRHVAAKQILGSEHPRNACGSCGQCKPIMFTIEDVIGERIVCSSCWQGLQRQGALIG